MATPDLSEHGSDSQNSIQSPRDPKSIRDLDNSPNSKEGGATNDEEGASSTDESRNPGLFTFSPDKEQKGSGKSKNSKPSAKNAKGDSSKNDFPSGDRGGGNGPTIKRKWWLLLLLLLLLLIFLLLKYCSNPTIKQLVEETEILELVELDIIEKANITPEVKKLGFAPPLDTLTHSIIDLNKYREIRDQENMIPVVGIMFDFDSAELSENDGDILAEFVRDYSTIEQPTYILIEGFTCTLGNSTYNVKLGERRTNAIKNKLKQLEIPETSLRIIGVGKERFISSGDKRNDLRLNRRANLTIIATDDHN